MKTFVNTKNGMFDAQQLGVKLGKVRDAIINGHKITSYKDSHSGKNVWSIKAVEEVKIPETEELEF